jgi:hypothetical protein
LASQWEITLPELVLELVLIERQEILFARGTKSIFMINSLQGGLIRQISFEGARINSIFVFNQNSTLVQIYGTDENQLIIYSGARRVWSTSTDCEIIGKILISKGIC